MARSETYTWLPLDKWAQIFGYNPWLFNGFKQFPTSMTSGTCEDVWYQGPDQKDQLSRDDLALAIKTTEDQIAEFVGFNLLPDYDRETVPTTPYWDVRFSSVRQSQLNKPKSVQVGRRYVWQVGTRVKKFLQNVSISRVDLDGDGFAETGRITTAYTDLDINQIRVYYPNENGADSWEIRPVQHKGNGVIEIPMYQLAARGTFEGYLTTPLDPQLDTNYLTTVDIYQVYCDINQGPILIWPQVRSCDPCYNVRLNSQCYAIEDKRLGFVKYNGAACITNCGRYGDPNQIELDYLSGWRDTKSPTWLKDLDSYWQRPIAYLATNFFPKNPRHCCDTNVVDRIDYWRDDYSLSTSDEISSRSHFATQKLLENPFGLPTRGAYYAFSRAKGKRLQ